MLAALAQGVQGLLDPTVLLYLTGGSILGLIFGLIPGLSGMTFLALLIPFTFGMEPLQAMTVLLAGHAVVHTSGGLTSVLLNVPGTASSAATLIDGFPMAQQGMAGRAVSNVAVASGVGGIIGAIVLIVSMPILRPLVMSFGSPELFSLCVLGITFIAAVGGGEMIKGLIAGMLGIILSLVGLDAVTATARLAFGRLYLDSGIRIIPLVLGLFAIPQIIHLMATGGTIAKAGIVASSRVGLWQGVKDVFIHWSLTLRTSIIGAVIGAIPGTGAEVAAWISYGHAKQTSKHPERFGHGSEEGIIGPEAADNSKEGGALIPTLAFGIPGSPGMAILLGGFLVVGLDPGPLFIREHLDIVYAMIITLAAANALGAILCVVGAQYLARITIIPARVLAPLLLVVVIIGSYFSKGDWMDIIATFVCGALGYAMVRFDYPRPPLILGFVLGAMIERYLHLSLKTVGPLFFLRPIS
ncbi:tripartite tricarboxylate transporter permease, partial [Thermodesulfobacteriota bacterium]